jgi:DNA-binding MarR family transcriptional regulator
MNHQRLSTKELLSTLDKFRSLHSDMPLSQAMALLIIHEAKDDGLSLKDLAQKAGVGMASASRYVAAFGKPVRSGDMGLGLVSATEDPMERRKKIIKLTAKGRAFVGGIIGEQE